MIIEICWGRGYLMYESAVGKSIKASLFFATGMAKEVYGSI